jgi:hypothetical protein
MIGNDHNIAGQALKGVTLNNGKYTVRSLGKILIRSNVLNSIRHLGSVVGHELNHYYHFNSGAYDSWVKLFGSKRANALDEYKAHYWEYKWGGSPSMDVMKSNLRTFRKQK